MHVLDNPAWHALSTLQQDLGLGNHLARRFDPHISPIAGLADPADPACWAALAALTPAGDTVCVFRIGADAPPAGWDTEWRLACAQMVCTKASYRAPAARPAGLGMRALTLADGDAMVALARLGQSGPMEPRTVTMGRYIGLFDGDVLAAMAGERNRFDGVVEVSGVCTEPAYRGRGYAQLLVAQVTERILASGDTAILHVREDNVGAIGVYQKLGYAIRTVFDIAAIRKT